jgi:hypothetical protein
MKEIIDIIYKLEYENNKLTHIFEMLNELRSNLDCEKSDAENLAKRIGQFDLLICFGEAQVKVLDECIENLYSSQKIPNNC